MNAPDVDLYPSTTFVDPLMFPTYLRTNDSYSIWCQVNGDWLLSSYVHKIDVEIVDDILEFKDHKELVVEIMDATRTFGWCGVQFYASGRVKVFSSLEWADWIKEKNPQTGKLERVGMKVKWTDDLGNSYDDELYFDDRIETVRELDETTGTWYQAEQVTGRCYLVVWKPGNGRQIPQAPMLSAFAIADVNNAVLSLAIQIRQQCSTLNASAVNPFFYQLIYGDGITPDQRKTLITAMSYAGPTRAIGAKKQILQEIIAVENGSVEKCILAIDQFVRFYAGETRVPLSFYLGEKQTGGLGDTGESTDQVILSNKKEFILNHFLAFFQEMFAEQFSETLPDLGKFYTEKREAEQAKQEKVMKDSKGVQA